MIEISPNLISLVICTRNRGDSVIHTLDSVFQQDYPDYEVILIDQSDNSETRESVNRYLQIPYFTYIHSQERGVARARNLGLKNARGKIVAFTDDDCLLPSDWIRKMKEAFNKGDKIGMVFCNVLPGQYDKTAGFIPAYIRSDEVLVKTPLEKLSARGIGAGMAVRRNIALALGGFDEELGPGGRFPDCEEGDLSLRTILTEFQVLETNSTYVVHEGFRTWKQGKDMARRNWVGIGAAYAKPLRCGYWNALIVVLYEAFWIALWHAIRPVFRLKKPRGLRNFVFFWVGFFKGSTFPIDKSLIMYRRHNS